MIYNRLGLKFESPTINTFIEEKDYIRMVKNLQGYLKQELVFINTDDPCPVAMLDDVKIYFVHYHTEEQARKSWDERKKRVDYDNLYLIMFDVDLRKEDIIEFGRIKCRNRAVLSVNKYDDIDYVYTLKNRPKDKNKRFMDKNLLLRRRFENEWDFVNWLNEGIKDDEKI